jgi:hypothetical protein
MSGNGAFLDPFGDNRGLLLEQYGHFYGEEHFALAFTASTVGDDAKRVTTSRWNETLPMADGNQAQAIVAGRGQTRNVAIVVRPSRLLVIECDSEDDLLAVQALSLPQTLTVRSSAPYKRHFYFRPPDELGEPPFVAFRFESGKLTADSGRYFLAPPSVHPSGAIYQFLPGLGPGETDIVELPEQTYRDLVERARAETAAQRDRITVDPDAKIRAGQRRDLIFRYACMLRRWGRPYEAILADCQAFNAERCEPPVERQLVETQVRGAMKKEGDQELTPADAPDDDTPWRSVSWPVFRDESPDEHRWVVEGLIPAGALGFIAGPPKKGKTWLGIGIALAIATGTPLLGNYTTEPRPVLYVALEGSRTGLRARIGALARGLGSDPDSSDLDQLHMLYRPRPFDLAGLTTAAWLAEEADRVDAALIVVDVLRAAARFRENDAEEFAKVRDSLEPLLGADRTVLLLHHFGKLTETQKERSPGERMAGSGAMYGALDIGLLITSSSDGARSMRVDVEARDFAAPDALGVAITGSGSGEHGGFTYNDTANLSSDEPAANGPDYAERLEKLFADNHWRTLDEALAKPPEGIGGAKIEVRHALDQAVDENGRRRFTRLDSGTPVGRHRNAQPYGTRAMHDTLLASQIWTETPSPDEVQTVHTRNDDQTASSGPRKGDTLRPLDADLVSGASPDQTHQELF